MRLALQALFSAIEANEEGAARRALLERRLRGSERSAIFFRRLRDVVDDESLRAPEIFAEESFPDANVVAEYLDNQASLEVTRAYEEVCWDSPEALGEVGRCYDILNNDALNCVVVPKNCRRRLYYIAWEEGAANVSTESGNAPILTDFTSSETREASEVETGEGVQDVRKENIDGVSPKAKEKRGKNSRKSAKNATSIGSTLAAERSWGRRVKRLIPRLALALGALSAASYGWQALNDDKSSETLQIETPKRTLAESSTATKQTLNEESSLRPTTISSLEFDEIPAVSLNEPSLTAGNDAFSDRKSLLNAADETYKLAILPNVSSGGKEAVGGTANLERARVGLGGEQPWNRRPTIEIPTQNNDVFSKSRRY